MVSAIDAVVLAAAFLLPFAFALAFFSMFLFRNFELKRRSVQVLFAVTFTLSVNLLLLAVFEIADVLEAATRAATWRLVLIAMILTLVFVIPSSFAYLLASDTGFQRRVAVGFAITLQCAFLYLFWWLGSFFPITLGGGQGLFSVEGSIGRLGVAGVTTAAILSGYGAVATPYGYLSALLHGARDADVRAKKSAVRKGLQRVHRCERELASATRELQSARIRAGSGASSRQLDSDGSGSGWMRSVGRRFGFAQNDDEDPAIRLIADKVARLEEDKRLADEIQQELYLELNELTEARDRVVWSRTFMGRIYTALGYFMSFYGMYRMFASSLNIALKRDPTKDTVTNIFEWVLVFLWVPKATAAIYVQPASFVFVGILVFTSVRSFLLSFAQLFATCSRSLGLSSVTSNSVVLLLAEVMGMYFVSSLLLMRMSMPEEFRRGITKAVGDIQFNFFHRWFDVIFLMSVCASGVLFLVIGATRRSRMASAADDLELQPTRSSLTDKRSSEDDDESGVETASVLSVSDLEAGTRTRRKPATMGREAARDRDREALFGKRGMSSDGGAETLVIGAEDMR